MKLGEEIWEIIEKTVQQHGAGRELSDRLKRYICPFCNTANPPGESLCIYCGAPLGDIQLTTCENCRFIVNPSERICSNCQSELPAANEFNL
jgi:RNA polymerase subunit RPABC4/transcription elongation factor Spt4